MIQKPILYHLYRQQRSSLQQRLLQLLLQCCRLLQLLLQLVLQKLCYCSSLMPILLMMVMAVRPPSILKESISVDCCRAAAGGSPAVAQRADEADVLLLCF